MKIKVISNNFDGNYSVFNYKNEEIGCILWFSRWKKWVWEQKRNIIMDIKCLEQVCQSLKKFQKQYPQRIMIKRKEAIKKIERIR